MRSNGRASQLRKEAMDGIVFLFQFVVPHHQDGLMKSEVMKGMGGFEIDFVAVHFSHNGLYAIWSAVP
jgi:hypothetical protein